MYDADARCEDGVLGVRHHRLPLDQQRVYEVRQVPCATDQEHIHTGETVRRDQSQLTRCNLLLLLLQSELNGCYIYKRIATNIRRLSAADLGVISRRYNKEINNALACVCRQLRGLSAQIGERAYGQLVHPHVLLNRMGSTCSSMNKVIHTLPDLMLF